MRIASAALGLLVLAILFALLRPDGGGKEAVAKKPTATPTPPRVATAAATPTAAAPVELSSVWVEVGTITPAPTPWPTLAPQPSPTARRGPSPTPRPADCVSFRWTARQVFAPPAHVLVEIEAVNHCRRDLGPFDLWFEISGWRDGGLVQSVRGHPFDRIRPRASGIVAIGLPGSIDWYDEVTVVIVD